MCYSLHPVGEQQQYAAVFLHQHALAVAELTVNSADLGLACTVAAVLLCDIEVRLAERLQLPQERPHAMMSMRGTV